MMEVERARGRKEDWWDNVEDIKSFVLSQCIHVRIIVSGFSVIN